MQPDFVVIGAMKCGTSTVCAFLEDHPDVYMVPSSEPNFFSSDENYAAGTETYERLFDAARPMQIKGEGSNSYSDGASTPETAARMAAHYPNLKLIYLVRHPIVRIRSDWIQKRVQSSNRSPATLDLAIATEHDFYVGKSMYWKNLSHFRAHFSDDQLFVACLEDLSSNRAHVLQNLCQFLEIENISEVKRGHLNPSSGKAVPTPLYNKVNRLPGLSLLKSLLPKGLKTGVKSTLLSAPATEVPDFSPETYANIAAELRDDSAQMLTYLGKSADFWKF